MSMQGQLAIVTGASRGIGRAIAMALAQEGATVVGTATTSSGAQAVSDALAAISNPGRGEVLDVTDAASSEALVDRLQSEFGAPSILVNNAGITRDNLAMRMKDDDWSAVIDTNLAAVFECPA